MRSKSRENMEHINQSKPDSGLGLSHLQAKVIHIFQGVPSWLKNGNDLEGDTSRQARGQSQRQ